VIDVQVDPELVTGESVATVEPPGF
jgi:hypothetical protein